MKKGKRPKVTGIDKRSESESRYGDLPNDSPLRKRHGERETEYQEKHIGRRRDTSLGGHDPARPSHTGRQTDENKRTH